MPRTSSSSASFFTKSFILELFFKSSFLALVSGVAFAFSHDVVIAHKFRLFQLYSSIDFVVWKLLLNFAVRKSRFGVVLHVHVCIVFATASAMDWALFATFRNRVFALDPRFAFAVFIVALFVVVVKDTFKFRRI